MRTEDSNGIPDAVEESSAMPEPEPANDALAQFNIEWNAKLEKKREEEFENEKASRATAEEERTTWDQQRDIRLKAKKESNRSEEQVMQEQLVSESENLKTWERVGKLIEAGEQPEGKGSDTSRMRSLFIQLKNEPLDTTRGGE
mmetsp:Transcript_890/g.1513  ORF Transcript_890/g.1513 Transcript_890/m.1513 type:complete len:144 (-) Transcript_890:209-640(-)